MGEPIPLLILETIMDELVNKTRCVFMENLHDKLGFRPMRLSQGWAMVTLCNIITSSKFYLDIYGDKTVAGKAIGITLFPQKNEIRLELHSVPSGQFKLIFRKNLSVLRKYRELCIFKTYPVYDQDIQKIAYVISQLPELKKIHIHFKVLAIVSLDPIGNVLKKCKNLKSFYFESGIIRYRQDLKNAKIIKSFDFDFQFECKFCMWDLLYVSSKPEIRQLSDFTIPKLRDFEKRYRNGIEFNVFNNEPGYDLNGRVRRSLNDYVNRFSSTQTLQISDN